MHGGGRLHTRSPKTEQGIRPRELMPVSPASPACSGDGLDSLQHAYAEEWHHSSERRRRHTAPDDKVPACRRVSSIPHFHATGWYAPQELHQSLLWCAARAGCCSWELVRANSPKMATEGLRGLTCLPDVRCVRASRSCSARWSCWRSAARLSWRTWRGSAARRSCWRCSGAGARRAAAASQWACRGTLVGTDAQVTGHLRFMLSGTCAQRPCTLQEGVSACNVHKQCTARAGSGRPACIGGEMLAGEGCKTPVGCPNA